MTPTSQAPDSARRPAERSKLTVLLFKDNETARTFQIPFAWFSRLGILLVLGVTVALAGVAIGVRSIFVVKKLAHSTPDAAVQEKVLGLQKELDETRQALTKLKAEAAATPAAQPVAQVTTPPPSPAPPVAESAPSTALLFSGLPLGTVHAEKVPITVDSLTAVWRGTKLHVHFNIQYVNTEGGKQQGHIVILARGAESLFVYPNGVFNDSSSASLISPARGEYFSVSRFRQVDADFGPLRSRSLRELQILLFDDSDHVLFSHTLKVGGKSA